MQKAKEYQTTNYHPDGTIKSIIEFNPTTRKLANKTIYRSDGTTVESIIEFDPSTGEEVKKTHFNPDGTISDIINFETQPNPNIDQKNQTK